MEQIVTGCEDEPRRFRNSIYLVYRDGSLFSERKNGFISPQVDRGYVMLNIVLDGKKKTINRSRLIAEAYIPNPNNLPVVRHYNDIRHDDRIENLVWGTYSDNSKDAIRNGLWKGGFWRSGENQRSAILNEQKVREIRELLSAGRKIIEIATKYNVHVATISDIKHNRTWKVNKIV